MNAFLAPIATIISATIGALVVVIQIGRQARNAIKQNRENEATKLKLEVYKGIIGISRAASDAVGDLSSFVTQLHLHLLMARQTQAELGGFAVPSVLRRNL
jgi:Na+-driven multidrug efflux pump